MGAPILAQPLLFPACWFTRSTIRSRFSSGRPYAQSASSRWSKEMSMIVVSGAAESNASTQGPDSPSGIARNTASRPRSAASPGDGGSNRRLSVPGTGSPAACLETARTRSSAPCDPARRPSSAPVCPRAPMIPSRLTSFIRAVGTTPAALQPSRPPVRSG